MDDSDHPVFDRLEQEIFDGAHTIENAVSDWFHRGKPASQTPAQQPATMAAALPQPQEETMSKLADLAGDIKAAIGNAEQWVTQVTETHLPAILAEAGKYEGSTIGKLAATLEGALIPEPFETMLNGLVEDFVKRYGQSAVAAPADPSQQPAEAPAQ